MAEVYDKANVHSENHSGKNPAGADTLIREHHFNTGAKAVVTTAGAYRLTRPDGTYYFKREITGTPISNEAAPTAAPPTETRWFDMSMWNKASFHIKFTGDTSATCSVTTYYLEPDGSITHGTALASVTHMLKLQEDFVQKKPVLFLITGLTGTATKAEIIAGGI